MMKEVINITIGGLVFAIEKSAHTKLKQYLEEVAAHFKSNEAGDEIVADIESGIAEKFKAKKRSLTKAVTLGDVETVMIELGQVQDFDDEEAEEVNKNTETEAHTGIKSGETRRLYRDKDEAILGGVGSGVAHYFGVDPVIVRVIFILLVFWGGFGLFAYLILWVIVPAAKTSAQKLSAKGKPTNLGNIKNYIEEKIKTVPTKTIGQKALAFPVIVFGLFVGFLQQVWPIARKILGAFLLLVSSGMIFVFSTFFMAVFLGQFEFMMDPKSAEILDQLNVSQNEIQVMALSVYACVILPAIFIFLVGISLCFQRRVITGWLFGILAVVWLLALSFTVVKVAEYVPLVSQTVYTIEETIKQNPNHEFYMKLNGEDLWDVGLELE